MSAKHNYSHCLRPIARRLTIDNSSALQLPSVVLRSARNARASVAQPNISRVEAQDRASGECLGFEECFLFHFELFDYNVCTFLSSRELSLSCVHA